MDLIRVRLLAALSEKAYSGIRANVCENAGRPHGSDGPRGLD